MPPTNERGGGGANPWEGELSCEVEGMQLLGTWPSGICLAANHGLSRMAFSVTCAATEGVTPA